MKTLQNEEAFYTDLVLQYFSETISTEDLLELNVWLELRPENKHYFEQTREIWLLSKVAENAKNFDSQKGFNRFVESTKRMGLTKGKRSARAVYFSLSRVAAIFAIAFCLGALANNMTARLLTSSNDNAEQEVVVPYGSKSNIKLPDGTLVSLNAGSKLTYKTSFGKTDREVWLEGEGFFSVAKDKKRSFIVKTDLIDVKAFGTKFNVKAYKEDKELRATLVEGSVGIYSHLGKKNDVTMLTPNQQAVFIKESGKISVENVDIKSSVGWNGDRCYFDGETLASVAKTIERNFNVIIKINSIELSNEKFSGSIDTRKNIYQLLKDLGQSGDFSFKQDKDTIVLQKNN